MSSPPKSWDELPTEILGIIFSHLQKRQREFLRLRLVCRSWNEECLRVLKKPECEFHQLLTETNINQYIDFLSNYGDSSPLELCTLPFHLNINLNIVNSEDTGRDQCYKTKLNKLTVNVTSLCTNFGNDCITKLTLNTPRTRNFPYEFDFTRFWLIKFLAMISAGLKTLDLSDFNMRLGFYTENEIESTQLRDIQFPKMLTLTFSKCKYLQFDYEFFGGNALGTVGTTRPIHPYIIDRSPNLENLSGFWAKELIAMPVNYDKLRSLLVNDWVKEPSLMLEKFLQSKSPKLQILTFSIEYYSIPDDRTVIFHRLLESVSSTLKSLTVATKETSVSRRSRTIRGERISTGTGTAPLMTIPSLPNLQHLRINITMCRIPQDFIIYDPEEINFNPETLPSLKSVELPLGFVLCRRPVRNVSLKEEFEFEVPVKFSTVNELTLRMNHSRWSIYNAWSPRYRGEAALRHLQKVFPNVSKLSIVNNKFVDIKEQEGVKHLLQNLTQSPLSNNILEISMEGFDEDFLGQVLDQIISSGDSEIVGTHSGRNNSFFLTNVQKISLGQSKDCDTFSQLRRPRPVVPNLTAMAKCFPSLQIIEVSEFLFHGINETERKELLQKFTSTFPHLWVHVIN